jgi:hypothetical protein
MRIQPIVGVKQNPDLIKDDLRRISSKINDLVQILNRPYTEIKSQEKSGSFTLDDFSTVYYVDASTGSATVTLTAPDVNQDRVYTIKKIDNTSNVVDIQGRLDGSTSTLINTQYTSLTIAAGSTQWYIL